MNRRKRTAPRRDPFEIAICVVLGLTSLAGMVTPPLEGSVAASLPTSWRLFWTGILLAGCVLTLVGALSKRVWGFRVEQIGLSAAGWSMIAYGVQVVAVQISRGTFSSNVLGGPLVLGLGLAFLWKQQQIWKLMQRLGELEVRPL